MDADKRATWVAALRSGKYKQTQGLLRNSADAMCCLGVAINEFCASHWERYDGGWIDGTHATSDDRDAMPSPDTLRLLGLTEPEASTLADLNDSFGLSFSEIANHIERNPDGLDGYFDDQDRERHGASNRT